jgi:hypothetical protein
MELKLIDIYRESANAFYEDYFIFSYNNINNLDSVNIEKLIIKFFTDLKNECRNHFLLNSLEPVFNFNFKDFENFKYSNKDDYNDWYNFFYDFNQNYNSIDFEFKHNNNQSILIMTVLD